jgi:hypothetical protein
MSALGHERRFRGIRDESGLPPIPERLRHRSEPTLRNKSAGRDPAPSPSALPSIASLRRRSQRNRRLLKRQNDGTGYRIGDAETTAKIFECVTE